MEYYNGYIKFILSRKIKDIFKSKGGTRRIESRGTSKLKARTFESKRDNTSTLFIHKIILNKNVIFCCKSN